MEFSFMIVGAILITIVYAIPLESEPPITQKETSKEPETLSYSKLVQDQTDKIKKILAEEAEKAVGKTPTHLDYPVVTKKDDDHRVEKQENLEKLRIKCEHFFKTRKQDAFIPDMTDETPAAETTEIEQTSPATVTEYPPYAAEETRTFDQVFKRPAQRIAQIPAPKNYISLRPLFLHKTVVNGETYYYLYNKQIVPERKTAAAAAPTQIVPQYEIEYNAERKPQKPPVQQQQHVQPLYKQQYKFVVPYSSGLKGRKPEEEAAGTVKYRSPLEQIDEYAYYPKHLQPSWMSVRVPYQPTWHMIRKLTIPTDFGKDPVNKMNIEPEIVTEFGYIQQ